MRPSFLRALVPACALGALLPGAAPAEHAFERDAQLRLEPGMHTGQIDRIGVDRACTRIVTGSTDKTARLWEIPTLRGDGSDRPRLLRTFRPPINPQSPDGEIHAVAMHPDGELVAVSGWTPSDREGLWTIYLFDTRSARVVASLADNPDRVKHLVFSPDGRYLAATMLRGAGVRVWRTGSWDAPIAAHNEGYGHSYGAAFDAQGRLYTVAYARDPEQPGHLRRYAAGSFELDGPPVEVPGGPRPYHVAVQPRGDRVAVGLLSYAVVTLYRSTAAGLERIGAAKTDPGGRGMGKLGWSADGAFLFAGGSHNDGKTLGETYLFRRWGERGEGEPLDFGGTSGYITHLLPCGDAMAFAARDPVFGLFDLEGRPLLRKSRVGVHLRRAQQGRLWVSPDGTRIGFPKRRFGRRGVEEKIAVFDLTRGTLRYPPDTQGLDPPDTTSLPVEGWNERLTLRLAPPRRPTDPTLDGQLLAPRLPPGQRQEQPHRLRNSEEWVSLAIAPNARDFVMGSEWRLRGYRRGAAAPLWHRWAHGTVWAANVARSGELLVAAYDDGTIRWHRMRDGRELLALFVHERDDRWIAWTPSGYFTAETGGEDLIGWHFNNGADRAADFFPAYKYRSQFSNGEIVDRVLVELDEAQAVAKATRDRAEYERLRARVEPPPSVSILSHGDGASFDDGDRDVEIQFRVDLPRGYADAFVDVLVDGVVHRSRTTIEPELVGKTFRTWVQRPRRRNQVSLVVSAWRDGVLREGESSVRFEYAGSNAPAAPKLFGLVIGIEQAYQKDPLNFPIDDARAVKAALERQDALFDPIDVRPLTDETGPVTAQAIRDALAQLRRDVKVHDGDAVTVIFYAGHGVQDNAGRFYLMPADLRPAAGTRREAHLSQNGLDQDDLFTLIREIPGRKLVFLDACHAGGVTLKDFVNRMQGNGRLSTLTYASTARSDTAEECENQGCFTQALVEALREGRADRFNPLSLTSTEELRLYLRERVEELTEWRQRPRMLASDEGIPPFPLSRHP